VADIILTPIEEARIENVADELDAVIEEFFADARSELSREQWEVLVGYSGACVRRALEVGTLLHCVVDAQFKRAKPYRGRGREAFVRQGLAAWRDSFAPIEEVWRLAPVLEAVPGGEARVLADVATLEVMAANRMFRSLDDQCASFLASEL
jgi:hypothetical protein